MSLTPFTPRRFTDSELFLKDVGGQKLLVKRYLNDDRQSRQELEVARNLRWSSHGFCVPKVLDIECEGIDQPYVVMEYVAGIHLSEYLADPQVSSADKLKLLEEVFRTNYRRHQLALANRDLLLVHTDPNTDNVILSSGRIYFIDFEHISSSRDILTAVSKEVATFTRRAVKNIGKRHLHEVIEILLQSYHGSMDIIDKVEELTLKRAFQPVHRLKHWLNKQLNPDLVTRYDIVDAIKSGRRLNP